tara:strand:+ start:3496 stop:9309 length:5814 start_codon:yes stop_codon:yes gene_type:complete
MPNPSTMSIQDAYEYYRLKGQPSYVVQNLLADDGYDLKELSGHMEQTAPSPAPQVAPSSQDIQSEFQKAQQRMINDLNMSPEEAYFQAKHEILSSRDRSGKKQVNYFAPDIDTYAQGLAAQAEGKSAFAATIGRMPIETRSGAEQRKEAIERDVIPTQLPKFEAATTDDLFRQYKADIGFQTQTVEVGDKLVTIEVPIEAMSYRAWKDKVRKEEFPILHEYENLLQIDFDDPNPIIRETGGAAFLRNVSLATSTLSGLVEGGARLLTRATVDPLAEVAGFESFEDYLTDQDSWISPSLDAEYVNAVLPKEYTVDGKRVSAIKELDLSLARHNARGLGLIGGGGDVGQKLDYILGIQDPTDESYNIGFNFTTALGTIGGLGELFVPITGGVFGAGMRAAKFSRIGTQMKAAGLYSADTAAALNKAYKAEQLNALKTTVHNPFKYLVAKPIDAAAAKFLDKDLGIAAFLQKRLGSDVKTLDVRNLAIAEFASNPANVKVAEYILDIMHRNAGSGVSNISKKIGEKNFNVSKLKAWFDSNKGAGIGTFDDFKASLDSVGIKLDDDFITSWGKQLVETEQIAAVRARALANDAPEALRPALLGKDSPLSKAIDSMTSAKLASKMPASAMKGEALALRAESFLMLEGAKKVTRAMEEGSWNLGYIERVSHTVFASPHVKKEAIDQVTRTIGKTIVAVGRESGGVGKKISFTRQQAKDILRYFVADFKGNAGVNAASISKMPYSHSTKQVLIALAEGKHPDINWVHRHLESLMQDALTIEVAGKGVKRTSVDGAIRSIMNQDKSIAQEMVAPFKATERGRYMAKQYENLFRPEELRSGRIIKYFQSMKDAAGSPKKWRGSALDETADYIRNRLSASQEEMRYLLRTKRTQVNPTTNKKYTQEEAMFSVMADEYTTAADAARRSIRLAEGQGAVAPTRQSDFDNLFDDYFTLIFGGQEKISPVVLTTAGKSVLDGTALPPDKIAAVMSAMVEVTPWLKQARTAFTTLIEGGETQQAWALLAFVHLVLEGKTLGRITPPNVFLKNLRNAPDLDTILLKSGFNSIEELYKDYAYFRHVPPMYKAEEHTLLMGITYNQKRSANIIDEGFARLTDVTGESVFPSASTLAISTKADAPYRMYLVGTALQNIGKGHRLDKLAEHHLKLTDSSIRLGMYSYMKAQRDIIGSVPNGSWVEALNDAATDIIGRTKPTDIAGAKAWKVELRKIKTALTGAYVDDLQSPFINYRRSIQGQIRAESTPESRKGLMLSLQNAFKKVEYVEAGVVRRSAGTAESISELPMIFDQASSLFGDMIAAANLAKGGSFGKKTGISPLSKRDLAEIDPHDLQRIREQSVLRERGDTVDEIVELSVPRPSDIDDLTDIDNARAFFSWLVDRTAEDAKATGIYDNAHYLKNFGDMIVRGVADAGHLAHRSVFSTSKIAKGGVLSGQIAPNFIYLAMNELSAPLIIWQTVGGKYSGLVNADATLVTLFANGFRAKQAAKVVAVSPVTGQVYRVSDVAKIISGNSISRGQASAELSSSAAENFVKWAGQHRRGAPLKAFRKAVKNGKDAEAEILKIINTQPDSVRKVLLEGWEIIRRNYLTSDMNVFNQISNASDTRHRISVFIKAINGGKTEGEAIKLAQEALFDYNNLTKGEREIINKAIWFWTFARNAMLVTLKNVIQNPRRAAALGKISRGMPRDTEAQETWTFSRPYLWSVNDPENQRNYAVYGIQTPFASAVQEMGTWLGTAAPMFDDSLSLDVAVVESGKNLFVTIAGKSSPWVKNLVGFGLEKELSFGEVRDLPKYADPRVIYMLRQNDDVWQTYSSMVKLKAKAPDKLTQNHTSFDGLVYELADMESRKRHFTFMQMMLQGGVQRTVRDWAPIVYSAKEAAGMEKREDELTSIALDIRSWPYEFFRNMGVIKIINEPTESLSDSIKPDVIYGLKKKGK